MVESILTRNEVMISNRSLKKQYGYLPHGMHSYTDSSLTPHGDKLRRMQIYWCYPPRHGKKKPANEVELNVIGSRPAVKKSSGKLATEGKGNIEQRQGIGFIARYRDVVVLHK